MAQPPVRGEGGPDYCGGAASLDAVVLSILGLTSVAILLFSYVGWQISKKRKEMEFITISERKRYQNITIAAVAILFSALIGLGTVAVG